MVDDLMHYDTLTETAMRSVIRDALRRVAREGLPGAHHFFITFDTNFDGVGMADRLRAAHPTAMTIVLQHQFRDLVVTETGFSVELSFNQIPERLAIPFDSIISFFDPQVEFGLRFSSPAADALEAEDAELFEEEELAHIDSDAPMDKGPKTNSDAGDPLENEPTNGDNIVSIDSFRNK